MEKRVWYIASFFLCKIPYSLQWLSIGINKTSQSGAHFMQIVATAALVVVYKLKVRLLWLYVLPTQLWVCSVFKECSVGFSKRITIVHTTTSRQLCTFWTIILLKQKDNHHLQNSLCMIFSSRLE